MQATSQPEPEPKPFEKFQAFAKQVLSVPKAEIDRREEQYRKDRAAKRQITGK